MSETKKIIANLSLLTGVEEIDPVAIERFFLDTINGRSVDPADAMQAAVMLWAIRRGIRAGDDMNVELRQLLKTKKAKHKRFDPNLAFIDSPAFGIVLEYVRGNIRHVDAVKKFNKEVCSASDRTIEKWIADIKPRAQAIQDLEKTFRKNTAK